MRAFGWNRIIILLVWGPLNGFGVVDPIESIVLGQRSAQICFLGTIP
jgi:hypothetical protein